MPHIVRGIAFAMLLPATLAAQGSVADINGTRIYYEVEGAGEPVVLVHGWTLNLRMWDPQAAEFARHYRVIRLDRRGFGKSGGAEDSTWDVADLRGLLDALAVPRAHVIGMSQGARAALAFAARYPDRVSTLILQGPSAPDGFGLPFNGPDRVPQEELSRLAATEGVAAARRAWAAHPLLRIPAGNTGARRLMDDLLAAYSGRRWLDPVPASGPEPGASMADLARVKARTLIISGSDDVPYLRIVASALGYGIPGARTLVIPGGGHMINIIQPRRFNRAVLDFLQSASDSARIAR